MKIQLVRGAVLTDAKLLTTDPAAQASRLRETYGPHWQRLLGRGVPFFLSDGEMRMPEADKLSGFFYQRPGDRYAQLIRCGQGSVDVLLADLRPGAAGNAVPMETFSLSAERQEILYVPPGCATGYLSRENDTCLYYKLERPFEADRELVLSPFDDRLSIPWPMDRFTLSAMASEQVPSNLNNAGRVKRVAIKKVRGKNLPDVLVITPDVEPQYKRVKETYWPDLLRFNGKVPLFLADAEVVLKKKHTLCGFYYQKEQDRYAQLIRCDRGAATIALVDLRPEAVKTYGKHEFFPISSSNRTQIYVPRGFGVGYLTTDDDTRLLFKLERPFEQEREHILNLFDDRLNINWPVSQLTISAMERYAPGFAEMERTLYVSRLQQMVLDLESMREQEEADAEDLLRFDDSDTDALSDEETEEPDDSGTDALSDEETEEPDDSGTDAFSDEETEEPDDSGTDAFSDEETEEPDDSGTDALSDEEPEEPDGVESEEPDGVESEEPDGVESEEPAEEDRALDVGFGDGAGGAGT